MTLNALYAAQRKFFSSAMCTALTSGGFSCRNIIARRSCLNRRSGDDMGDDTESQNTVLVMHAAACKYRMNCS